jgi:protein gp37
MGTTTAIAWTDKTWSPWQGCTKVSPACDHCYAENIADTRFHVVKWGAGQPRKHTENWDSPRRWNKQAAREGRTIRVFPSMCDPFDNEVPAEWRTRFFQLIRETPHLTWLLLTKRIGNANRMLRESNGIDRNGIIETPLPNIQIGATACNQAELDRDRPKLLDTIAAKRFLCLEPLLGPLNLRLPTGANNLPDFPDDFAQRTEKQRDEWFQMQARATYIARTQIVDWVIAGGESGHGARPSHPDWFRKRRDDCAIAGVPYFHKQNGEYTAWQYFDGPNSEDEPDDLLAYDLAKKPHLFIANDGRTWDTEGGRLMYPPLPLGNWCLMVKVGTKKSGRHLDGREHLEFPK